MNSFKLIVSKKDWFYIVFIGIVFGFLFSLFLYFVNNELKTISTIFFSIFTAVVISIYSFMFISFSNDYILPRVKEKFWYFISFIFSFSSGFLGFILSYYVGLYFDIKIVHYIYPYWFYISIIVGFLTFLIGMILHQFVSMKHRNELIHSEVLETKIKALENELSPHFLFNALNSISELIYVNQEKAEKATLDLSQFLRNAINKESLVTIKTELDMVKTYLEIENIRFEDKISLKINLNKDDEEILVPKFSIQLLVENAIKHGFNLKELNIFINVSKNKIKVSNNGKLTKKISYGTGLHNLKRRLELLNIGSLNEKIKNEEMVFEINIKENK